MDTTTQAPERVWLWDNGAGWTISAASPGGAYDSIPTEALDGDTEYVRADLVDELMAALGRCADELEDEVRAHYLDLSQGGTGELLHPSYAPKFKADMEAVRIARAAIAKARNTEGG